MSSDLKIGIAMVVTSLKDIVDNIYRLLLHSAVGSRSVGMVAIEALKRPRRLPKK